MSKIICLWASPRNISTALMYSFAQRLNTKVIDEPFYAYYLTHIEPELNHPGKEEILASQHSNIHEVIEYIEEINKKKDIIFIKNMTHHLRGINLEFSKNWHHIILTREPKRTIASFSKVIKHPSMNDLGYQLQYDLAVYFKKSNLNFHLIDAENLTTDPIKELRSMCNSLNIDFDQKMLSWEKGGIKEDGVWAKYWYENVHNSEGFNLSLKRSKTEIENGLMPLLKECNYFYKELLKMGDKN